MSDEPSRETLEELAVAGIHFVEAWKRLPIETRVELLSSLPSPLPYCLTLIALASEAVPGEGAMPDWARRAAVRLNAMAVAVLTDGVSEGTH